jgi:hypothetical protein
MMGNDPRPHYAHQPNLMSESSNANVANRGDGILYAVLGAAVSRYRSYYKTPFLQPTHAALTQELARQVAWAAAVAANQVSAYVQDGKVTISAAAAGDVPVTGTTAGDVYGGQRSGWLALTAGQSVTLDPDDPHNTAAPVMTGTVTPGATVSTTDGSWTGTPTIAFARQWQRRASATAPWTDIPGATAPTYVVTTADAGQTLRAVIAAGNRISSWSMAATAPVGPPPPAVAPANSVAPAISGTASVGRTLTAGTGTWTGTAPIAYAYQWQRTNTNGATWAAISGATARTYVVGTSDRGYRLRVRVTASNSAGSAQAFSSAVGPVPAGLLCGLLGLLC